MKASIALKTFCLTGALLLALVVATWAAQSSGPRPATAIFAGGCFWSVQKFFDKVEGVLSTTAGYTGGTKTNPTYEDVVTGTTGHAESVRVAYDPKKISYEKLLDIFWHNIDPFTVDAQFCDTGNQYRTVVFYFDETQKELAERSKKALQARFRQPVVTQIVAASRFYPAEDYHQKFYLKNPERYELYRLGCGRDQRLAELWGTPKKP